MSIGIIYCETFEREIAALSTGLPKDTHFKMLSWGLHIHPDQLLEEVHQHILALQDRVDAIVLGYGRCQCMDRLPGDYRVPVFRPAGEDCIGVLLGQQRYDEELSREPGTWFLTPGWTCMGIEGVFGELQINRIGRRDIDPLQLAHRMLEGYRRALYIDMNLGPAGSDLPAKARQIAKDLRLCLEKTTGTYDGLADVLAQAQQCRRPSS